MPDLVPDPNSDSTRDLHEVRSELRRLGYLDHSVERYLLQDALRPEKAWSVVWHLTAKVAGLIGVPVALLSALVIAATNGHLTQSPFDLLPLFVHLLPPVVVGLGLAFLVVSGLLVLLIQVRHARRIEAISFGLALVTSLAGVGLALWQGHGFLPVLPRWQVLALLLAVPLMAWTVFEVVHGGLLTLAIRLTDLSPERRSRHGRWVVLGLVLATFLGMMPAALDAGRANRAGPPSLPTADHGPLTLIGIDGVLASELDFLIGAGELPALSAALDAGAVLVPYRRQAGNAPSSFWTTVATGIDSPFHGMESLDSFRPLGVSRPLLRSGWLRGYWSALAQVGLAEYRPVLSSHRAVWTFWELAGRGGSDSVAVNWWGTFPAEAAAGVTIAHGAYQILADAESTGAVEPASLLPAMEELAASIGVDEIPETLRQGLRRVLDPEAVDNVLGKALRPDTFYRHALTRLLAQRPTTRLAALYLPALDIANDLAEPGSVAQAELVRWQLRAVDELLSEASARAAEGRSGALVLVFDAGRRATEDPALGRLLLWNPLGCPGLDAAEPLEARDLGALLLRLAGLPQSREISQPPAGCTWPAPPLTVDGYGPRHPTIHPESADEYLEQLKSLGYL